MTAFLPLFPLKLVVYPRESLNLHVFEPRYKQLIRECEQNAVTFGITAFINNKIMDYGTEIKLEKIVKRHENGELDIITKGIGVFKIKTFYEEAPNKLYGGADIERVSLYEEGDPYVYNQILKRLKELFQVLKIKKKIPKDPSNFSTYELGHYVGFSLAQEYEFLCISSEVDRQQYMYSHLNRMIPIVREMARLRKKAQMNGHFKNIIPPK